MMIIRKQIYLIGYLNKIYRYRTVKASKYAKTLNYWLSYAFVDNSLESRTTY